MPTAADIVSVLQASNIPIHLLGLIRVGKIMSFPTKKIAVDPKGEPAFFFFGLTELPLNVGNSLSMLRCALREVV